MMLGTCSSGKGLFCAHVSPRLRVEIAGKRRREPAMKRRLDLAVQAAASAGGFDASSKKKKAVTKGSLVIPEKALKRTTLEEVGRGGAEASSSSSRSGSTSLDGYSLVGNINDFVAGKPILTKVLASGKAIALYQFNGKLYASDAYSTAYQFPLIDARLFKADGGAAAVEVPLDGTQYRLEDGAVLTWCPKGGNPLRSLLGTLKEKVEPVPLKVFATHVDKQGQIMVKITA